MTRIYGSSDLFPDDLDNAYHPYQTINYVASHDGFCLYDLVAYNAKHNLANGQNNSDGTDNNLSWNCGWEGDQEVPAEVMQLRKQQIKNFFAILMLSNGTPMFRAGDEFMNTQVGTIIRGIRIMRPPGSTGAAWRNTGTCSAFSKA